MNEHDEIKDEYSLKEQTDREYENEREAAPGLVGQRRKVKVSRLPECDFCGSQARYDGRTTLGPWANMCERCYSAYGVGLGLGKGQRLELEEA